MISWLPKVLNPLMIKKVIGLILLTISSFYLFDYAHDILPQFAGSMNLVVGFVLGLISLLIITR